MAESVEGIGGVFFRTELRAGGVEVDSRVEEHEYGRFGWEADPDGNRFELRRPA